MQQTSDLYKNRDIEVLRALAISFVVVFHWVPHVLERMGRAGAHFVAYTALWSGVDLFFCISGFVIASSLLREAEQGPAPGRFAVFAFPFWIRRMWRLWPSAWLWIAISLVMAYCFNSTGLFGTPRNAARDALTAILNVYNYHDYVCVREHSCGSLGVYWSLSLEEQFYFVFPFLVFFLRRRALVVVLLTTALMQFALNRPVEYDATTPSLLWLTRTDAICYGALIALWRGSASYERFRPRILDRTPLRWLLSALLAGILGTAAAPAFAISASTGILAIASAILVWIASYGVDYTLPRIRTIEPALTWLGSRSYSLYLIHEVGGLLSSELRSRIPSLAHGATETALGIVLTVTLTLALSELNYRFVELPLRGIGREKARQIRRRLAGRATLLPTATTTSRY